MKRLSFIIFGIVCSMLFSCSKDNLDEGVLVSKIYKPEVMYQKPAYDYVVQVTILKTHVTPEQFIFMIRGKRDGKTVTEKYRVDKKTYNKFNVGDTLEFKN